jgi:putative endonuclease
MPPENGNLTIRKIFTPLEKGKTMHYVYILRSTKDGKYYTGCTKDLRKRFSEHNDGKVDSTKDRRPFELIYYEASSDQTDAFAREKYLKTGMGKRYLKNRLKSFLSHVENTGDNFLTGYFPSDTRWGWRSGMMKRKIKIDLSKTGYIIQGHLQLSNLNNRIVS